MKSSSFVVRFLLLLPAGFALLLLASVLLIKYDDPALSDIRIHNMGYNTVAYRGFHTVNRDDDVVLVGDSTLLMGIMPEIVERKLGRKVISLPLYGNSGLSGFTLLLDNYLKHNKKPGCIVFYLAASAPYCFDAHTYEKSYTLLKYGAPVNWSLLKEVDFLDVIHAAGTVSKGICRNAPRLAQSGAQFNADLERMNATKGFVSNAMGESLGREATFSTRQQKPLDLDFIDALRKRYQGEGVRVLYCVAPVPEGDGALEYFRRSYRKADNAIVSLPNSYFSDCWHLLEQGAAHNSGLFAEFLKTRL
jgi:hypothetical protein